jgi:hypothetical protein
LLANGPKTAEELSSGTGIPAHTLRRLLRGLAEPGKPVGHPHRLIDLEMMVTLGGKERTAGEFESLLDQAGLKLEQITPIENSFFTVVEAARA